MREVIKVINYKCKNCGGQMSFGDAGSITCPYCGSKSFFSDEDFKENEIFRKRLLEYYKAKAEQKKLNYDVDFLWTSSGVESFEMEEGQAFNIEFMKKFDYDGIECFLAKENVVYIFDSQSDATLFLDGINKLIFPPADDRLYRSFPELSATFNLKFHKKALAFKRRPNCYPASMFSPWDSEDLAWVISRMENICCALNYSQKEHNGITMDSIWVDPILHEAVLFGDWRNICELHGITDLIALRKVAISLAKDTSSPKELYHFLNSEPEQDAFADFKKWDEVIKNGFGGHKFKKMEF